MKANFQVEADPTRQMRLQIEEIINGNMSNVSASNKHNLTLTKEGKIGLSNRVIVWKGFFDRTPVAIKITWDKQAIDREMRIFTALNATKDPNIEKHGIPKVYYHGLIIGGYHVIAMTLCDGSVEDRYAENNEQFSDLSILLILKRAVCGLAE